MLGLVLLVFAFVCACLATWGPFGWPAWRFNPSLIAAALAFYFAALIFGQAGSILH